MISPYDPRLSSWNTEVNAKDRSNERDLCRLALLNLDCERARLRDDLRHIGDALLDDGPDDLLILVGQLRQLAVEVTTLAGQIAEVEREFEGLW